MSVNAKNRDYSMDMQTINKTVQANGSEDLHSLLPCGHKKRYLLGSCCLVCENMILQKQVQTLVDRCLGNYDLD